MTATAILSTADPSTAGAFGLRVLPAPRSEPPTDEERESGGLEAPPLTALVLPFDLSTSEPTRYRGAGSEVGSEPKRVTRTGGRAIGRSGAQDVAGPLGGSGSTDLGTLETDPTPVRLAARRFLATCVEVIGGYRPMAQLRPLCVPVNFADIADGLAKHPSTNAGWRTRGLAHLGSRGTPPLGRSPVAPPRNGRVHQTGPSERIVVRRVQICETVDGVAEIAVVLARRDQVWAMALRVQRIRGTWLCSHLEVI